MAEELAEFDEWLRRINADMHESVESAIDTGSGFERWLRKVDADMHESVESAMNTEKDLVAFKQELFARIVAVAHREGNDAPDQAVRSILANPDVVDRYARADLDLDLLRSRLRIHAGLVGDGPLDRRPVTTRGSRSKTRQPGPTVGTSRGLPLKVLARRGVVRLSLLAFAYAGLGVAIGVTFVEAHVAMAIVLLTGQTVSLVALSILAISSTTGKVLIKHVFRFVTRSQRGKDGDRAKPTRAGHHDQLDNSADDQAADSRFEHERRRTYLAGASLPRTSPTTR